jgi:hypothetical protein
VFPSARIVVLSPFTFGARPSPALAALSEALRQAAGRHGATFVDTSAWMPSGAAQGYLSPGRGSLTAQGRAVLAARVAQAVRAVAP